MSDLAFAEAQLLIARQAVDVAIRYIAEAGQDIRSAALDEAANIVQAKAYRLSVEGDEFDQLIVQRLCECAEAIRSAKGELT